MPAERHLHHQRKKSNQVRNYGTNKAYSVTREEQGEKFFTSLPLYRSARSCSGHQPDSTERPAHHHRLRRHQQHLLPLVHRQRLPVAAEQLHLPQPEHLRLRLQHAVLALLHQRQPRLQLPPPVVQPQSAIQELDGLHRHRLDGVQQLRAQHVVQRHRRGV